MSPVGQKKLCLAPEEHLGDPEAGPDVHWTLNIMMLDPQGAKRASQQMIAKLVYHRQTSVRQ